MNRELTLQVGGAAWRHYSERLADPAFKQFSKQVFARDRNQCVYCSFTAAVGMTVVNLDHNYENNKLSNLATACPFCQQCLFLEAAGRLQSGGGTMIYLPEMSQAQLNALCHVFYASIINGSTHAKTADNYIQSLKLRAGIVEKLYGKNMSNPSFMGQMLIDTPVNDIDERRKKVLANVRLLPSLDKFESEIMSWAQQVFAADY